MSAQVARLQIRNNPIGEALPRGETILSLETPVGRLRAALIDRGGRLAWLRWSRFDYDACFAALFEKYLSACNDLGLLAEEYDVIAKSLRRNFPQALSHLALVHTALNLAGSGPVHRRAM